MEKEKLHRAQHDGTGNFDGGYCNWRKSVDGRACRQRRASWMRSQISCCDGVSS
ncbi:uncharacterized protein DS421_16g544040 [Arachis hypogaea]|nr:uncharacterized protein DS421_16g544040 [Arachis hypogaea]